MRILVAGGTGVIGSRVVPLLTAAGHDVIATSRSIDRLVPATAAGAEGMVMDARDAASVDAVVDQADPDAIVHLLTDLATEDFASNAQVRIVGTRNLVSAAERAGVTRMVAESIAWVGEPDAEPGVESVAIARDPDSDESLFPAVESLEHAVLGLENGVVLRMGMLYGRGTWFWRGGRAYERAEDGIVVATVRHTSFVHADDAARAVVQALDWPHGIVNIVDDDPADADEWAPELVWAAGGGETELSVRSRGRASTNALAAKLGWVPEHPTWRDGPFDLVDRA
ncbi:NAD-dependent epimerase/dehydratase family protein [Paramicrobacterium agarici]|uniref:NAD-dependent epimerase/dehydratase family protein n=1 Tax=Paramicrobacterium agarici TaxID=630514 RepID=UPI00115272F4|nr:NAD(P)-dependent oxidoreductase [Microbacterium agarici]TQO22518.1 nucleoside-diphosphate-sugar epimerase [Microbacterium agarici]